MADGDLWVCPQCGVLYVEDSQMWEAPWRCPHCGADLYESDEKGGYDG